MQKVFKIIKPIIFYSFLFLICLALASQAKAYDYDLWARLIVGKAFFQTGHILTSDFLSYIPTHEWIDHEWGASVIIYAFFKVFAHNGIIILQSVLTFLIFVFVHKTIDLNISKDVSKYNILFYFIGLYVIQDVFFTPVRCHMFTFMFFAMFLYIFEYTRVKNNYKPLILVPFLMILWNNIHGGVVAGLGLMLLYALGEALNKNRNFKYYIYTILVSIPFMLINPYGIKYLEFLFMANTLNRVDVVEWWGLFSNYNFNSYLVFKNFMLFVLGIEAFKVFKNNFDYKTFDKTKFLILLVTLILAVQHAKLLRFFIIAGTLFTYNDFYTLVKINPALKNIKNAIVYSFILLFSFSLLRFAEFRPKISTIYPIFETEFVKANNLNGKILTNFGLGSYVAYKLHPNNLIYMDGRYEEVYYDEELLLLKKFHIAEEGWDALLKLYPPDVMILENGYPIIDKLAQVNNWHQAYKGDKFTVFVNDKLKKDSYVQPTMNFTYYENSVFDTNIEFRKK